jgi:hypothetical protein
MHSFLKRYTGAILWSLKSNALYAVNLPQAYSIINALLAVNRWKFNFTIILKLGKFGREIILFGGM